MISLCLIVKPDPKEAKLLKNCLESAHKYVDEICITITGKNEKIEEVCRKYKAKVSYFKWINDFAAARNFNFSQAKGDWIFWMDSDDKVKGGENLKNAVKLLEENGGDVGIMEYLYDFDKFGNITVQHKKARLIKNDGCVVWKGKLHEDLIPERGVTQFLIKDIEIIHCSTGERKEAAKERNLGIALLQYKENPDDPKNTWDVANAYLALGKQAEAIEFYNRFIPETGSEEERFLAWQRKAHALMEIEEYKHSAASYWEAMKIRPWYPDPYLGLGEMFFRIGDYKRAKEFLIQGLTKEVPDMTSIVINPRDYDYNPLQILARVYFYLNRPEDAKKCLEKCLEFYPKNREIKKTINDLDEEIKKLKKIDEVYEKALKCKTKEEIKKIIDEVPLEYKSHPKLVHLKNIHFIKKESSGKDLAIYCYQTDEQFDPDVIWKQGRGGSEEAVYHISKRLADLGWNVTVYANCGHKERKFGNVMWKPWWTFNPRDKEDVLVVWRHPAMFEMIEINANKKYVWLHDILTPKEFTAKRLSKIDKIIPLSKWQRDLFPHVPDEKFMVSANGIEPNLFKKNTGRDPYRLIYTSSYDRGLECLLEMFPYVKKEIPQAELHVFYGWDLWDRMHSDNPTMRAKKNRILQLLEQPGVYEHGRIPQRQIIEEYFKAGVWAYPTEFGEISCITAMKSQAAGCIPVTTNVAALDETVQFGLKVDSKNIYSDKDAQTEWIAGMINILKKPPTEDERQEMIQWARKKFDWDNVAKQWDKEFSKSPSYVKD